MFKKLYHIARRECGIMRKNPIYLFCMVIFPIVVVIFFTTLMKGGVPTDMPVGIVDQDNSATSRQLVHKLDAFQTTKVVAHYENMAEARHAIQKNEIYAFLLIPDGTEAGLMAQKQLTANTAKVLFTEVDNTKPFTFSAKMKPGFTDRKSVV